MLFIGWIKFPHHLDNGGLVPNKGVAAPTLAGTAGALSFHWKPNFGTIFGGFITFLYLVRGPPALPSTGFATLLSFALHLLSAPSGFTTPCYSVTELSVSRLCCLSAGLHRLLHHLRFHGHHVRHRQR